ncbi:MAG: TetM/TetW/TetO/TetS family tetracycline resistance ribosomal protection protein [Muribaculum sp.]|nr:TetM/TetW/TetO/TetS family tetracycline resistance ribosomal protection protein [Muribaculum sp.]
MPETARSNGQRSGQEQSKRLVLGILAHVDAGKTTLAESMLYLGGRIRKLGRVDHGDAFLDNFALERERGITIFSKQAQTVWKDLELTLLDTPGHVDFSAETERTLQVLDYAVLVINGADGVQGHTRTLWKLLERYEIPVFLFVNKMDQPQADGARLMASLKKQLDANCVAFSATDYAEIVRRTEGQAYSQGTDGGRPEVRLGGHVMEEIATCGEALMNAYLERGELTREEIAEAVWERRVFPCYFGAALRLEGVEALLDGVGQYGLQPLYPEEFGARVFKISRDPSGVRLTHLKVTGGSLRVKMWVENRAGAASGSASFQEKADQLRIYSGAGFVTAEEVSAGGVCAVAGLTKTFAGQGLGAEEENGPPVLEPVLSYRVELPDGADAVQALGQLRQLEEEEPLLHILWQEESREIHAQVMGEVQIEVLEKLIAERFGLSVRFGEGSILYKETIAKGAVGIGHFEPLRHYAEVALLLEPGERGSGLQFASLCGEDMLDRNWQRLIRTHLEEREHVGVLTGSPVTDLRVLLVAGRSHVKHTEGGDFRQATYRALRQGLMNCENVLLEPMFSFVLELPAECLGRAMADVQRMCGSFESPVTEGGRSTLVGRAPVAAMGAYQRQVNAYTHGEGHLSCVLDGYAPCHNAEEVIAARGYDPEADVENPTGSVFCAHGAGFVVSWDRVPEYAHTEIPESVKRLAEAGLTQDAEGGEAAVPLSYGEDCPEAAGGGDAGAGNAGYGRRVPASGQRAERVITQEEIETIFRQTYGGHERDERRRRRYHVSRRDAYESGRRKTAQEVGNARGETGGTRKEACLLVDGYNIIFAWEELRELARANIDSARDRLMDILSNYQGTAGGALVLVFDAYKVKGNPGRSMRYHNIDVVYTKEAETADQYIERSVHELGSRYQVTVATSDALEQTVVWGAGALRMSAADLYQTVEKAAEELREVYTERDSRIAFRPFL